MDLNSLNTIKIQKKYVKLVNKRLRIANNLVESVQVPLICLKTTAVMKTRRLQMTSYTWNQVAYHYLSTLYGQMTIYMFELVQAGGTTTCRKVVTLETRVWDATWEGNKPWPPKEYIENICLGYHVERYSFLNSLKGLKQPTRYDQRFQETGKALANPYYIQNKYKELQEGLTYEDIFI